MKINCVISLLLGGCTLCNAMEYLASWIGYGPQSSSFRIPKIQTDPTRMRDTDYCAEILQFTLQQSVDYADQFYTSIYGKLRESERDVPRVEWRGRPAQVWCQPDMSYENYVDCSMAVIDFDGQQHSAHIARYFVISANDKVESSNVLKPHYDQLVQSLKNYPVGKMENPKSICLKILFESRPFPLQILSPYHRKKSHFDFLVRRSDGSAESFSAVLVPTMTVPRRESSIDILDTLIQGHSLVFYRLMMDPLELAPQVCVDAQVFPVVHPKQSVESRDRLSDHISDVKQVLGQLFGLRRIDPQFSISLSYKNKEGLTFALCEEILSILSRVETNVDAADLLDCSHPLPVMTDSPQCPNTIAVIGSSMFQRVIHVPGLWIAIRGQNRAEARTGSLRYLPLAVTTDDFYGFDITDNEELSYHKLHIHKGAKGIFLIAIWRPDMQLVSKQVPQLPVLEEASFDYIFSPANEDQRQIFPNIYPIIQDYVPPQKARRQKIEEELAESLRFEPSAPPSSPSLKVPLDESDFEEPKSVPSSLDDGDFIELVSLNVPKHPIKLKNEDSSKPRIPEQSLI